MRHALLAALALLVSAASFAGARREPVIPALDRTALVPLARGRAVIPDDLLAAGKRWGIEAQKAALAARPQPSGSFRFAVIGDVEPGRFPWQRVFTPPLDSFPRQLRAASGLGAQFVLQLGDLVSKGDAKNYREIFTTLSADSSVPFFPVIGNHDRSRPNGDADKRFYSGIMGATDFYFDYGGWRFVGLDTADRTLTGAQLEWLKSVLPTDGRSVIFTHVPPRFLKGKWYSPPAPKDNREEEDERKRGYVRDLLTAYFDDNSAEFGDLLAERKVARVYAGHIHAFGVAKVGPTLFVLSGGGGSPLYPLPPGEPKRKMAHFLEVIATGGALSETVHELDGPSYPLPLPPGA